jgi:murein L,D-transpeptidase YcbB/YkuD
VRAGALALALLGAATAHGTPAGDPDWHIPLAPPDAGPPAAPAALRLQAALDEYRGIAAAGGWPALAPDPAPAPGTRSPSTVTLRNRLRATGDYRGPAGTADAWFYDSALEQAVGAFQARHGLPATGAADPRTVAALNVPAADRVRQLEATLTRWAWLPRDLGVRYLFVNVPGGTLELVQDGAPVLAMRVIAGHPDRPTPSFKDVVQAIVVNPSWSVPRTLAVEDLLPAQQEDPGFLARLGIRVYADTAAGPGRQLDPARIDWQALGPDRFPYRLVQQPGPLNSLGRYKFVLGNPWDIYLHDTPSRRLFDLNSRTLSSGCVRLEEPGALARRLLAGVPSGQSFPLETRGLDSRGKDSPTVAPARTGALPPATRTLKLPRPVDIYVVYLTSWVTPEGVVHFRPDVYGRDARLR